MNPTERNTKKPFATTGIFAMLRGLLRVKGTSAPSGAFLTTLLTLIVLSVAPSLAQAEFSRPYITQLTGAPTGPLGEQVPFQALEGLAVDPDPLKDDVFVGTDADIEGSVHPVVDEFSPSNAFLEEQHTGVPNHSLAFDDESGQLVEAGAREFVAIDDSVSVPEAYGDIYFATETGYLASRVRRGDDEGNPVDFKCDEGGKTPE